MILHQSVSAISSSQAMDAAKYFAESSERIVVNPPPIESRGYLYWLVYLTPMDKDEKNLIIALDDEYGLPITEKNLLRILFMLDYKEEMIKHVVSAKTSFNELKKTIDESIKKIDSNAEIIDSLITQVEAKNYPLNLNPVQRKLIELRDLEEDLLVFVIEGADYQRMYEIERSAENLNQLFAYYNKTFKQFDPLFNKISEYQKLVDLKKKELTKLVSTYNISYEDGSKIHDSLTLSRDVGIDSSFIQTLSSTENRFQVLYSDADRRVSDYVESFLFRKASKDAAAQYLKTSSVANAITQNSQAYKDCGIDVTSFVRKWREADNQYKSTRKTTESLTAILSTLSSIEKEANSIQEKGLKCNYKPPTQKTPISKQPDYSYIVILAIAAAAGFYAYRYFKRMKEASEEEL